ncbi:MAG: C40 family peptidase [Bacteroides sp.]|nr:C40 family peptidase [Bacteroides sp.]
MKKRVLFILLVCVPAFTLLAQSNVSSQRSEENEQGWGIVNLSVANLHDKADFASEMITQALMGMPVKVLQTEGWHRIQTPDDYLSWVHKAGIQLCTRAELHAWNRAEKVVVTAPYGTVYSTPNRKSQPVSDVVASNRLKLLGKKGKYYRVGYPDGREGYLHKSLAMPEEKWRKQLKQDAASILQTAHRFMGIPYLWAGTSTKGVDCSGFVRAVLLMHDIIIPRDASQQAREGERLEIAPDYSNLQPGDLVFFGRKAADGQKERVVHVAFYLGNKRFIHSQGDVRIGSFDPQDELFDAFNLNRLLFAARFLPYINKVEKMNTTDKNPYYNIQP